MEEEFEDTKGVIRIRKSKKSREHNGLKKKVLKDKQVILSDRNRMLHAVS